MKLFEKIVLYFGFTTAFICFNFWDYSKYADFYIGNAIYLSCISFILKYQNPKSFICYLIFCASLNNLCDELFFDNTKVGLNEFFALICVPIIWYLRKNERI